MKPVIYFPESVLWPDVVRQESHSVTRLTILQGVFLGTCECSFELSQVIIIHSIGANNRQFHFIPWSPVMSVFVFCVSPRVQRTVPVCFCVSGHSAVKVPYPLKADLQPLICGSHEGGTSVKDVVGLSTFKLDIRFKWGSKASAIGSGASSPPMA